jgi:hypothetical protein
MATFEAFTLLSVFADPANHPDAVAPVTDKEVRVPTDGIFV